MLSGKTVVHFLWQPGSLIFQLFFFFKQKLPVEVVDIDSTQINQVEMEEAGEHVVLEELTANATCTHQQHLAPGHGLDQLLGLDHKFFCFVLFCFLERGRGRQREGERERREGDRER